MKPLLALLITTLLCGSAFASGSTAVTEIRRTAAAQLSAQKVQLIVVNKKEGTAPRINSNQLEVLSILGDSGDSRHKAALDSVAAVKASIESLRTSLVALGDDAEAKTFLARLLDPALAGLGAMQKNPSGVTDENRKSIARLAAALEGKS